MIAIEQSSSKQRFVYTDRNMANAFSFFVERKVISRFVQ